MWGVRTKVIMGVMETLGSVPMNLKNNLNIINMEISVEMIQKWALLGSKRILGKGAQGEESKQIVLLSSPRQLVVTWQRQETSCNITNCAKFPS